MGYKDWRDRIAETVTFLRGYVGGVNGRYAEAVGFCLGLRHQGNALKVISEHMAQGGYPWGANTAQQKDYRKRRRAIILVRAEILGDAPNLAKTQTTNIVDNQLDHQLDLVLGLARQQLVLQVTAAWQQFCNQTGAFLQNNEIFIRKDDIGGVRPACFGLDYAVNRYRIHPAGVQLPNSSIEIPVQVCHVPVTRWDAVQANPGNLPGVDADRAYPVVTTQLTGCSYVYQINGNAMQMAHIWPHGSVDAKVMGVNLTANAGFLVSNGGNVEVFRAEDQNGPTGYMHVATWTYPIAVYNGTSGAWEVHVQQVRQQGGGPIQHWRAA